MRLAYKEYYPRPDGGFNAFDKRSVYKTKKGFNQRADEIISSLSTSKKRSDAYLSDANILQNFQNPKIENGVDYQNVNEEFNRELDNFENGKHRGLLHLGIAGNILNSAGINVSITLSPSVLKNHLKKHGLKVSDLKGLAKALQTPNLIYQHGKMNIATVIVTDLEVNDKKISIALRLDKNGNIQELNNVSSVHGKNGDLERERLVEANDKGILKIKYIANKENVLNWLGIASLNGGSHTANPKHLFFANIIKNFQNPKIENDLEYMRTPSGVIYGAKLPDGTIYINPEHLNANTPIHEFVHLWEQLMPEKFAEGVKLFKNTPIGNKTFAQLRKNKGYKNYSEEKLWSEALVTYIGDKGEQLYHSSRKDKFIDWVKSFFKEIGAKLYSLSGGKLGKDFSPSDHLSKFTNNVLSDLLSGKELQGEPKKTISESFKGLTDSQLRNLLLNMGLAKPARC